MINNKTENKIELSAEQKRENAISKILFAGVVVLAFGWTVIMWVKSFMRFRWRNPGRLWWPKLPRLITIWVVGNRGKCVFDVLEAYHINNFFLSQEWSIEYEQIGMRLCILVNPSMFDQVDSILFNQANGRWIIESIEGELRQYDFQPHHERSSQRAQPVKRTQKQAKLGKTYSR